MATYHIIAEQRLSPRKQVRSQLVRTALFLVLYSAVLRVVDGRWIYPSVLVILGLLLFLGNLLTSFLWPPKEQNCDLEIDDDGVRMLWNRHVVRTVRSDRVRYVREWGSGSFRKLVISERGPIFTRCLWGGIGVPSRLPDYEQIKAQALTWLKSPEGR